MFRADFKIRKRFVVVTGKKIMHEPVKGFLEDYLSGKGTFPDVEAHLAACQNCRAEVRAMQSQTLLFHSLRAPREVEPNNAFYARVMLRIENSPRPSPWSLFGESMFARRLAFASFASLLLIGAFLIPEKDPQQTAAAVATPEFILAGDREDVPPPIEVHPAQRGVVLVNLASYQDFQ